MHTSGILTSFILTTQALGVRPTAPGLSEFEIYPHPGDLTSARGIVPTPKGDIKAEWKKQPGIFTVEAAVPAGTTAEIVLERSPQKNQRFA